MDEINSEVTVNELRAELIDAVKALRVQVVNQNSLSVGIDLRRKQQQTIKKEKTGSISKEEQLKIACQEMSSCQLCPLGKTRKNLVFGTGNPEAKIVFVGEAPGADEDEQGLPFVGRAGQLLTDIIKAMGYQRKDVYICNILKCRPPGNRNPQPDEISMCEPFLKKQLQIISPEIICALGSFAAKTLLNTEIPISALRGRFHSYEGIKLMPTYHPAYLLRNPSAKKQVWEDVQMIMKEV